ncbi:MAG TPA: hypothetical protein VMW42_02790 [Desulfatiglandales bacterium]|nr:hypothetical protein [Desulfatiglandales bacterium]
MRRILCILILICSLLTPITGLGDEGKRTYKETDPDYYWEKAKTNKKLPLDEFNNLIRQLEGAMKVFKKTLSKIRIEDTNLSYERGKVWEATLINAKENLESGFKSLTHVRKNPNSIYFSLDLYVALRNVRSSAYDLSRISVFDKIIDYTDIDLKNWNRAFLYTHLYPLAFAMDTGEELYKDTK